MKLNLIIFLLTICLCNNIRAQNEYYDACAISKSLDAQHHFGPNQFALLHKYYPNQTNAQIATELTTNPFLKKYFDPASLASNDFLKNGNLISSIGNVDVTNFADGLAKFLIERSKEELNVAFFRKFEGFLKEYPEIKVAFPTTVSFINNISAYNYTAMLPALKAAFQKDLNALCGDLIKLRDPANYGSDYLASKARIDAICNFLNNDVAGRSVIGALIITDNIIKGDNAADAISNLASDQICNTNEANKDDILSNSILFTDLISKSLRSKDDGRIWVTKQEVSVLVDDDNALNIYLGLLYASDQKNIHKIHFGNITFASFLTDLSAGWPGYAPEFKSKFKRVAQSASAVSDNSKTINSDKKSGNQSSILVYADYASSISTFLKNAMNFMQQNNLVNPNLASIETQVKTFTGVIDDATNICYDIKSQNYSAMIMQSSLLLTQLLADKYTFKSDFIKYGTFMAGIVEAKSSDDVKAVFDAAVLPVGSSSVKRLTNFNVAINAYIGLAGGAEYMPQSVGQEWKPVIGATAPVGVAFSWGNIHNGKRRKPIDTSNKKGGQSFTIFVPLIDVGAIATFRLGDDSTKIASNILLKDIIAPGLYLYYGFGNCPISLGIGGQVGPQLRDVTAKNINETQNIYFRFGLNLVVDIPFFNLYTKN
jgi:hypothetical protein